jgi:hypothetical protein
LREGEAIALSWACEATALREAVRRAGPRILPIDFSEFLIDPATKLHAAFAHLDLPASHAEVETLVAGPLMHRYSKAPEFAYDTALRQTVLDEARAVHGAQIRMGLAWLDDVGGKVPLLGEALDFYGR